MGQILYLIKILLGIKPKWDWEDIIKVEKWIELQYSNTIHTDAGVEQILINEEVKYDIPICMSKLHEDWYLREDYILRKKEFQEM